MDKRKLSFFFLLLLAAVQGFGQSRATVEAYIERFKDVAIAEMQRTGVPASITLAQGIHETGAGTSDLVLRSNNHFGIKCKTEWTGERVYHDDDARGECFRKYDDPLTSYRDHSDFLRNRPYYAALFQLDPTDYEAWAHGLKKAGYATNPRYPQILIKLIRDYNLQDYTLIAMGRKPAATEPQWAERSAEKETTAATAPVVEPVVQRTYPDGIFSINGANAIYVQKGTSYLKIATDHDIPLARLFDFNDIRDGDVTEADGLLFLQRKRKTGASERHVVVPGETLYSIAQSEGIRLESLLAYNYLTPNVQPAVGTTLYLTGPAPSAPTVSNEKNGLVTASYQSTTESNAKKREAGLRHTVQAKETLFSIAKKYAVGVDELKEWNSLSSNELKIGQQLIINQAR